MKLFNRAKKTENNTRWTVSVFDNNSNYGTVVKFFDTETEAKNYAKEQEKIINKSYLDWSWYEVK